MPTPRMVDILKDQFARGLCQPHRSGGAGIATGADGRHAAPADQAGGPASGSAGGAGGQYPSQTPEQKFELAESGPAPGRAGQPSLPDGQQRPDVLQAQENMHDASAQIGVAIANRLPNIQLTANAGSTALAIGQVFGPGTGFWSIGSSLTATIFDGKRPSASGTRRARRLYPGGRAISQHRPQRLSECRRHSDRAGAGCRRPQGRGQCRSRRPDDPEPDPAPGTGRLCQQSFNC